MQRIRERRVMGHSGVPQFYDGTRTDITVSMQHVGTTEEPNVTHSCIEPSQREFVSADLGYVQSYAHLEDNKISKKEFELYVRQSSRWSKLSPAERASGKPPLLFGDCFHCKASIEASSSRNIVWKPEQTLVSESLIGEGENTYFRSLTAQMSGSLSYTPGSRLLSQMYPGDRYDPFGAYGLSCDGISLARRNALENLLPKIGEGFTLPLFLKEFSDVTSLIKGIWKYLRFLYLLARNRGPIVTVCQKIWIGQPLRTASDRYLAAQFGLLPLVSDLKKIVLTCLKLRKQIAAFLSKAGKFQIVHCQEAIRPQSYKITNGVSDVGFSLGEEAFGIPLWTPAAPINWKANCAIPWSTWIEPSSAKYHLTAYFTYYLPYANWLSGLLSVFDAFGVNWAPSQIWAAIPFSFVVDWVIPIGPVISSFDKKNVEVYCVFDAVVESVKYDWFQKIEQELYFLDVQDSYLDSLPSQGANALNYGYRGSVYRRKCGKALPSPSSWQGFRMPHGMKWVSAACLLIQRTM